MDNIYAAQANSLSGQLITFDTYKDKVMLIVNTASECGFTPQFKGLEELNKKYADKGLAILGFPCDQFGHQEPGSNEDIAAGCVVNFGVTFQMFSKIDVNGSNEHPLFTYLKSKKGSFFGKKIKWNFTKFLVDRNGKVIARYAPTTTPEKIEKDIIALF